jgi:hypothetical protein
MKLNGKVALITGAASQRPKVGLLGPCERELSWSALWGKADVP